jgi:tetratricopeptide (TPR) repeat protein
VTAGGEQWLDGWAEARRVAELEELGPQARGWYDRAMTLRAQGRLQDAADAIRRAPALAPASALAREAAARVQFEAARFLGCHLAFAAMAAVGPRDDYAWYGLGVSSAYLRREQDAVGHLRRALRLRPGHADYADALDRVHRALAELGDGPADPDSELPIGVATLRLTPRPAGSAPGGPPP